MREGVFESLRTLKAIGKRLSRVARGGNRAIKCAVHLVLVGVGLQGETSDTAGLHAPTAARPAQAAIAAQRGLFLEGVAAGNVYGACAVCVSSPAGDGAGEGVGALYTTGHVVVLLGVLFR